MQCAFTNCCGMVSPVYRLELYSSMVAMSRFASELIDFAPRQSGCKITAGERSGEQMRGKRREVGEPTQGSLGHF